MIILAHFSCLDIHVFGWLLNQDLLSFTPILADQWDQFDVMGDFQGAWKNFVETGQIWALGIGFFFGYLFRSLTSY